MPSQTFLCCPLADATWAVAMRSAALRVSQDCWVLPKLVCNGLALLSCTADPGSVWCFRMSNDYRLLLFLIFFPRATPPDSLTQSKIDPPTFRTALAVTGTCLLHAIITIVLSLYFVLSRPHLLQEWANFLGIFSTVLASIQYFPQIYTTFMLKRVGALSIPMMCIQTPGSFLWAYSLATRLGPSGWSAWGIYCVTGCLQGTLLVMGSYFEIKERQRQQAKDSASAVNRHASADLASEETPLLDTPD